MRKLLASVIIASICFMTGCGQSKQIQGVTYQPYGLINQDELKNPDIAYTIPFANVLCGVLFFETIIIPIYIIGYDLYEPVGPKQAAKVQKP